MKTIQRVITLALLFIMAAAAQAETVSAISILAPTTTAPVAGANSTENHAENSAKNSDDNNTSNANNAGNFGNTKDRAQNNIKNSTKNNTQNTAKAPAVAAPLPAASAPYASDMHRRVAQIYQGPDFHHSETTTTLHPRPWLGKWLEKWLHRPTTEQTETEEKNEGLLSAVITDMALLLKWLAITALALGALWLLWRGYRWLAPIIARPQTAAALPLKEAVSSVLPNAITLPGQISDAALRAWQHGDATQALSLLYRGALSALTQHYGLELPVSATEGECLRLTRYRLPALVPGFAPLVYAWSALAYAQRLPEDFSALLQIYRQHFEISTDARATTGMPS